MFNNGVEECSGEAFCVGPSVLLAQRARFPSPPCGRTRLGCRRAVGACGRGDTEGVTITVAFSGGPPGDTCACAPFRKPHFAGPQIPRREPKRPGFRPARALRNVLGEAFCVGPSVLLAQWARFPSPPCGRTRLGCRRAVGACGCGDTEGGSFHSLYTFHCIAWKRQSPKIKESQARSRLRFAGRSQDAILWVLFDNRVRDQTEIGGGRCLLQSKRIC